MPRVMTASALLTTGPYWNMEAFKQKFVDLIIERPYQSLILFTIIWFASLSQIPKFYIDFSPRRWFDQESEIITNLKNFEQKFQSDESIVIAIYHPQNVLNEESLKLVEKLQKTMWQVPNVSRVQSLFNTPHIRGENDEIRMEPVVPDEFDFSEKSIKELNLFFKNYKEIDGYTISADRKFTVVHSSLGTSVDNKLRIQDIVTEMDRLLEQIDTGDSELYIYGTLVTQEEFRKLSQSDNIYLIPLVLIIVISLILYLYRSFFAVFSVFIIMLTTVSWTAGLLCFFNWPYSSLLAAIPGILMAICIADSIHVIESIYKNVEANMTFKVALRAAMLSNFSSTFLTSFTTFVGFISLTFADIVPIFHLGVLVGLGALSAWLFTYLLLGSLYSFFGSQFVQARPLKSNKNFSHVSSQVYIDWIQKHRNKIYALFTLCFFSFLYFSTQNIVDSDPISYFSESTEYRKRIEFVQKSLPARNSLSLEIDSGKADGIKSVEFLKKIEAFDDYLNSLEGVLFTDNILHDLKKLYKAANNDSQEFYRIPENNKLISELLFFYSLGLPEGIDLNFKVSSDYRHIKMMNLVSMTRTSEAEAMTNKILKKAKELGLDANIGGAYSIYLNINPMVVATFIKSILSALFFIFIIVLVTYRSFSIAFVSFIPNVYSLLTTGFLIHVCGMYLDIGTSIVSAICLGISIDDTIHFIAHYSDNLKKTNNIKESLVLCLDEVGSALIITTVILTLSFFCYILAGFVPSRNFGILTAATLVFALIADLVLLPAVLLFRYKTESKGA